MNFRSTAFLLICLYAADGRIHSQTFANFREYTITITSDTTSKTVILSNLFENEPGGNPDFIGAARWTDANRNLDCRSLLSFELGPVFKIIKPEQVVSAQLVLTPVRLTAQAENPESFERKLEVLRITEQWDDDNVIWNRQPLTDNEHIASKKLSQEKKDKAVKINVTQQVRDILRYGNNGFMLRYEEDSLSAATAGRWFASCTNEDAAKRPVLVLEISLPALPAAPFFETSPLLAQIAEQNRLQQAQLVKPEVILQSTPSQTPPPPKLNPVVEPVRN